MSKAILVSSGGTGAISDDITVMQSDIPKGLTAVTHDSDDEIVEGTLELTGNASDDKVLTGSTYYNDNLYEKRTGTMPDNTGWNSVDVVAGQSVIVPKGYHDGTQEVSAMSLAAQTAVDAGYSAVGQSQMLSNHQGWVNGVKVTGSIQSLAGGTYGASSTQRTIACAGKYMTSNIVINASNVNSILSFNFASRNYSTANFKWQNPDKGPFLGVVIRGKSGSYPANVNDGNLIYKGYGTNTAEKGISYSGFKGCGTGTWYFRAFSYAEIDGLPIYSSSSYNVNAYFTCYDCSECGDCSRCSNCNRCSDTDCDGASAGICGVCGSACSDCDQCSDYCYHESYPSSCSGNSY